ncbi:MAG: hypothetical protein A3F10_01830 [Coxiella sp. RIFCSPHIGHO2_12_FULL_42_15]|nr:MAG: hypothetical protein A3F10_01830 [Coxiella sp. RIFCSPHIGHO2_12_FULL_42_15]
MKKALLGVALGLISMTSFAEPKMHYGAPVAQKSNLRMKAGVGVGTALQIRNFTDQHYDVYLQQTGYAMQGPMPLYPVSYPPYNQITLEDDGQCISWPVYVEIDYPGTHVSIFFGNLYPSQAIVDITPGANVALKNNANEKAAVKVAVHQ